MSCKLFQILGFAADKIGYKTIFLISIAIFCISATVTDLTPRHYLHENHPQVQINTNWQLNNIIWPSCNADSCNLTITDFKFNMTNCKDSDGRPKNVSTVVVPSSQPENVTIHLPGNGTFCGLEYNNSLEEVDITCDVIDSHLLSSCTKSTGNHFITLFVFTGLRLLYIASNNIIFSVMDGAAMTYMQLFDGDYGKCILFQGIAGLLGSFVGGYLVIDSDDPNGMHPQFDWLFVQK